MKNEVTRDELVQDTIVLRSVFGKVGLKYYIQPCKDKYGRLPNCVKAVNSMGDMIMTDDERNSEESKFFIPENATIVIEDGKTFNLQDPYDRNWWEAIKNCILIAQDRWAKNELGENLIDGTMDLKSKKPRYGIAELYVERPGAETRAKVTRKKKVHQAAQFIFEDERGADGRVLMARLLGKNMRNMPDADVEDFLLQIAEKNPDKIIQLYTGGDTALRILFADARDRKIILYKNRLYTYSDNIVLGATDDAVITWMKDPKHKKVLQLIRKDVYPELEHEDVQVDSLGEEPVTKQKVEKDPVVEAAIRNAKQK